MTAISYSPVTYNPFAPGFREDPYPQLHQLRTHDPVHWSAGGQCWVITRYDDALKILSDGRFGIRMELMLEKPALKDLLQEPFNEIIRPQILSLDPPDHTRIRDVVRGYFTEQSARAMGERIQVVVDDLIDRVEAHGAMDLMADFAVPIPLTVISEMLGIDEGIREEMRSWTNALMRSTDPTPMSAEELSAANWAANCFQEYFLRGASLRRKSPRDDLLTVLTDAVDKGVLTEQELVANCVLIFCAGHDTTIHMFGNAMLALFRNPQQLRMLRDDPTIMPNGMKELLRYDTTLQIARRVPGEDVEIRGRRIPARSYVLVCLGAANRDPEMFPDPDRLDLRRAGIKTLSFGGGIHTCLGARLAPVEGEIAITTLLRRLPGMRPVTLTPPWRQNVYIRGLEELKVSW